MKVEIKLTPEAIEPHIVIYAHELTAEVQSLVKQLENKQNTMLTVKKDEKYYVIKLEDVYMVRMERQQVIVYGKHESWEIKKRLYELEEQLGKDFFRISKTTLINLKEIDNVEPSFNGMMYMVLKNGLKDYISRKYLPEFKKYLGL